MPDENATEPSTALTNALVSRSATALRNTWRSERAVRMGKYRS
ncbi:hypothetical protein [Natrinema ejinorense]|nr:hypothetical protein [Natrinema ejinorense]